MSKWNNYAEALDKTDLYNYAKNGYDWCDIFYDWCLVQEFGVDGVLGPMTARAVQRSINAGAWSV